MKTCSGDPGADVNPNVTADTKSTNPITFQAKSHFSHPAN